MIKYFCDVCGKEVIGFEADSEFVGTGDASGVDIKILRSVQHVWNGGHICYSCLSTIVLKYFNKAMADKKTAAALEKKHGAEVGVGGGKKSKNVGDGDLH